MCEYYKMEFRDDSSLSLSFFNLCIKIMDPELKTECMIVIVMMLSIN